MKRYVLTIFLLFFAISPIYAQDGPTSVQEIWNSLSSNDQIKLVQDETFNASSFLNNNTGNPKAASAKEVVLAGELLLSDISSPKAAYAFLSAVNLFKNPESADGQEQAQPESRTYMADGVLMTDVIIRPKNLSYWTGHVSSTNVDGSGDIRAGVLSSLSYRGYAAFDISAIPANATITACKLNYFVRVASPSATHILQITDLTVNPVTNGGAVLWNAYSSPSIVNTVQMRTAGPQVTFLPTESLQSKVGTPQWNLGFKEDGDNATSGTINGYNQTNSINCTVTYTVPVAGYLVTSPAAYTAPSAAGQTTLTIQSNIGWSVAVTGGTWATTTSLSGSNSEIIGVNFTVNTGTTARVCTVEVRPAAGSGVTTVGKMILTQAAAAALSVNPTSAEVSSAAGFTEFAVTSNGAWTLTENADFANPTLFSGTGNATVRYNYGENLSANSRTGVCSLFMGGVLKAIYTLTQRGKPSISLIPESAIVTAAAGTRSFTVTTSSSFNWSVSEISSWLTLNRTGGTGNGTVTITYDANSAFAVRSATITVSASEASSKTFILYQDKLITGIEDMAFSGMIPRSNYLGDNYPNPFNPSTRINFGITGSSDVSLKVYTMLGKEVSVLLEGEELSPGTYTYYFNAEQLPSGIYLYILTVNPGDADKSFRQVKKMTLLK